MPSPLINAFPKKNGIRVGPTKVVYSSVPIVNGKLAMIPKKNMSTVADEEERKRKLKTTPKVKGVQSWYPKGPTSNGIGVGP